VFGEAALAEQLRVHAFTAAAPATGFIKLLAEAGAAGGSPFGLFGALREVEGRIDLKQVGLFKVVTAARCLAIRHGITARGTGERLRGLAGRGLGGQEDLEAYAEAHALLLDLVLRQQLIDIAAGGRPGNAVRVDRLDRRERRCLKAALKALQTAPDLVRELLFATPERG
jgi:CBS domain-containing protein